MSDKRAPHYKISACYFPGLGEVELTWEGLDGEGYCSITTGVTEEQGNQLAEVVGACVYHKAELTNPLLPVLKRLEWAGGMFGGECPECQAPAPGPHAADCELDAQIKGGDQ